jgi:hypothetical protein
MHISNKNDFAMKMKMKMGPQGEKLFWKEKNTLSAHTSDEAK